MKVSGMAEEARGHKFTGPKAAEFKGQRPPPQILSTEAARGTLRYPGNHHTTLVPTGPLAGENSETVIES